jgi:hypothetical protein
MFSVKRLCSHLRLDSHSQAEMIRAILTMPFRKGERIPVLEDTAPSYEIEHDSPSRKLYVLNRLLDGFHGVEIIRSRHDTCERFNGISYLNAGDTYAATIMYDHGRRMWMLGCIGDILENPRQSRRFE